MGEWDTLVECEAYRDLLRETHLDTAFSSVLNLFPATR